MKTFISYFIVILCINFSFSQETIPIPDVAFEETLIALKFDTNGLNGTILVSDAEYIVNLNIYNPLDNKDLPNVNSKIKDLTGIESFPNLKRLVCYGNEISKIDVSKNSKLNFLNCSDNKITNLDVSQNPELYFLSCDSNQLQNLKLGIKNNLIELYCNSNMLTSLDLKYCTSLEVLDTSGNQIKQVVTRDSIIKSIPESWSKDESTVYVSYLHSEQKKVESENIKKNNIEDNVKKDNNFVTTKTAMSSNTVLQVGSVVTQVDNSIASPTILISKDTVTQNIPVVNTVNPALKTISNSTNTVADTNGQNISYDEMFKKKLVYQFDKRVMDSLYINKKIDELQKEFKVDKKLLIKWISKYSRLPKF